MTIDSSKLGWLVAAALAGVMATSALSGFQATPAPKFATVDTIRAFDGSALADTNSEALQNANKARMSALDFINRNRAMDPADARKFAELSVKDKPTDAEKKEVERLRAAGEAATQARSALMTKNPPSDADKTALAEYGNKANANQALLQTLSGQYQSDMEGMQRDLRAKTMDRVRDVIKSIAAKQGYTVVFDTNTAPYAANDLTDEAIKALKK